MQNGTSGTRVDLGLALEKVVGGVGDTVRTWQAAGRASGEQGLMSGTGGGLWFAQQLASCQANGMWRQASGGWDVASGGVRLSGARLGSAGWCAARLAWLGWPNGGLPSDSVTLAEGLGLGDLGLILGLFLLQKYHFIIILFNYISFFLFVLKIYFIS